MNKSKAILILGVLLTLAAENGCDTQHKQDKEASEVPGRGLDSYVAELSEIYSEAINGDSTVKSENSLVRIIAEYSEIDYKALPSDTSNSEVERETLESFRNPDQKIEVDRIKLNLKTMQVYFYKNPKKGPQFTWGTSPNKHFEHTYTLRLSKVGMNKMKTQALVYLEEGGFGERASGGHTALLSKENNRWKFKRTIAWWTI